MEQATSVSSEIGARAGAYQAAQELFSGESFLVNSSALDERWKSQDCRDESRQHALGNTRANNFPEWYQEVVKVAELAENSPVRGCMVILPWGYGIWQNIQHLYNEILEGAGVQNMYFPLFIPKSLFDREARHAAGFAKEMAIVTHSRLKEEGGKLIVDPSSKLEEPLVVRPTSELIIGEYFREHVHSYRDLPLKVNQWANVVRWEMRTRLFLRTAEFLWHEGHSVHASQDDAQRFVDEMLAGYAHFARHALALPVLPGEKPAMERFPGAERTLSIEAMMQDGKALQAGTSHYLGQNFAKAGNITFKGRGHEDEYAHTASWGMSTRMIGALVMAHGDDDGLRLPPAVAHRQVAIIPVVPREAVRAEVMEYASGVARELRNIRFNGYPLRVELDTRDIRGGEKNWSWIKRGVPLRIEIGPREVASGSLQVARRDFEPDNKVSMPRAEFMREISALLSSIHHRLYAQAEERLISRTRNDIHTLPEMKDYFSGRDRNNVGFVRVPLADTREVAEVLMDLKVSVRCIPFEQRDELRPCIVSGAPDQCEMIVGRAY